MVYMRPVVVVLTLVFVSAGCGSGSPSPAQQREAIAKQQAATIASCTANPECAAARAESERAAADKAAAATEATARAQAREEAAARTRQADEQKSAATLEKAIKDLQKDGFITGIDGGAQTVAGYRRVFVNGGQWKSTPFNTKQNFVKAMSRYRNLHEHLPQVTVHDNLSGEQLASYGPFAGVTFP